jgi:hypothetical protein
MEMVAEVQRVRSLGYDEFNILAFLLLTSLLSFELLP